MTTIQDAIDSLYQIAVVERKPTSPLRLRKLANYCCEQLAARGVPGVGTELPVKGVGRTKNWDAALIHDNYFKIGISLKSMLRNVAGSVPNRYDDLTGEVLIAQNRFAKAVIGYIILIDVAEDSFSNKHGMKWTEHFRQQVTQISARTTASQTLGHLEASLVAEVDFSAGPRLVTPELAFSKVFDTLVLEYRLRW